MEKGTICLIDIYKNFERYQKKDEMLKIEYLGKFLDEGLSSLTARFKILDYGTMCPKYKNDIISVTISYDLYCLDYKKLDINILNSLKPKFLDLKNLDSEKIKSYELSL